MNELDAAYENAAHIPGGDLYFDRWEQAAHAFRTRHALKELGLPYGVEPRQYFDLYHPSRLARGCVIFVHGGYWKALSPRAFSHLAQGAIDAGYACAMPSYTLAPDARIAQITQEIAAAIDAIAKRVMGPVYLVGHSAGGHLVARMGCNDIKGNWKGRIAKIMPISPIGDLRPLMNTSMNGVLRVDEAEASRESPVLHPRPSCPVHLLVGQAERPAFLEQARALSSAWGAAITEEPRRHHFDVIDGLEDHESKMMQALLA